MQLTRREKHVLIVAAVIMIILGITQPPAQTVDGWELFYLFVIVVPLGFYVALDPERKKEG